MCGVPIGAEWPVNNTRRYNPERTHTYLNPSFELQVNAQQNINVFNVVVRQVMEEYMVSPHVVHSG